MDNVKEWISLSMPELPTMASCKKKKKETGRRSRRPDQSTGCTELDNKEDLNRQRQLSPGMRVNTRQINITKVNAKAPRSLLTDQSSRNNFVCHVTSAV